MKASITKRLLGLILPVPLLMAAAGCEPQTGANRSDAATTGVDPSRNHSGGAEQANQSLRAAAEPFEAVTEQAFNARWDRLDNLIAEADAAVRNARPHLSGAAAAKVDRQLAAIRAARAAQDRTGIALAAIESYRAMVEAQEPDMASPPVAVSLLDYAGFRYDALAQARSPDWPEMLRLTEFARQQWQQLAPKVQSRALPGVMESALGAMTSAAERKDVASARQSAAVELALVDLLEEQVASQPPRPSSSNQ